MREGNLLRKEEEGGGRRRKEEKEGGLREGGLLASCISRCDEDHGGRE